MPARLRRSSSRSHDRAGSVTRASPHAGVSADSGRAVPAPRRAARSFSTERHPRRRRCRGDARLFLKAGAASLVAAMPLGRGHEVSAVAPAARETLGSPLAAPAQTRPHRSQRETERHCPFRCETRLRRGREHSAARRPMPADTRRSGPRRSPPRRHPRHRFRYSTRLAGTPSARTVTAITEPRGPS